MDIVLSSHNRKKIAELQALLAEGMPSVRLLSPEDIKFCGDVEETGTTFAENARQKAAAMAALGYVSIADDSGLCVDALDGAPGVYSARYSGGDDEDNNDKLLSELHSVPDERRTAQYVCCMVCVLPGKEAILSVQDSCSGVILHERQGEGGFGYDPLFYFPELGCTFAQLTPEQKNEVSHRGKAVRRFAELLPEFLRKNGFEI